MKQTWRCRKCEDVVKWDGNPGPDRGGACAEVPWGTDVPGWMNDATHEWEALDV